MRFQHELRYDAAPEAVYAMLADPAFRESVCAAQDMLRHDVSITPSGSGMKVRVDQTQAADGIPSFAKKFVGDQIQIVQDEDWTSPEGAALKVTIPGKPGQLVGTIALVADGAGTVETVSGDIKVGIPLVGGKIEKLIGDLLGSALRVENRVGKKYLAG